MSLSSIFGHKTQANPAPAAPAAQPAPAPSPGGRSSMVRPRSCVAMRSSPVCRFPNGSSLTRPSARTCATAICWTSALVAAAPRWNSPGAAGARPALRTRRAFQASAGPGPAPASAARYLFAPVNS